MTGSVFFTLQVAGLLHDIGKLLQYGTPSSEISFSPIELSAQFVQQHKDLFSPWIDSDLLTQIVREHRDQDVCTSANIFSYLLSQADKYSSPERDDKQLQGNTHKVPLVSVFSRLSLFPFNNPQTHCYQPQAFGPEVLFPMPEKDLDTAGATQHVSAFSAEMNRIMQTLSCPDYFSFYCRLLTILEKYTWCFPASKDSLSSDVSLYDHLRTASAILSTMYLYHKANDSFSLPAVGDDGTQKFLLAAGDLSGIQPYLFDITNIGVGGAARRLRARSFFLTALTTGVAYKIIKHFQLPPVNILSKAGGNFYILLPNVPEARSYLDQLQKEINSDLLNGYGGDLAMHITYIPFAGKDFPRYNSVAANAREMLSRSKLSPFKDLLTQDGAWCENSFLLSGPDGNHGYCRSCRKLPVSTEDPNLCRLCLLDTKAGRWLTKVQTMAYYATEPELDRERIPLPGGLWVVVKSDKPLPADPLVVLAQDPTNIAHFPALTLDSYIYVPTDSEGNIASFDSLADQARGKKLLGIVKADIDNLGALFALGLGEQGSISRVSTMSRLLETFFGGWLPRFLKKHYPDAYMVYSGGDDLLVTAPWNQAIELAVAVREQFSAFTACNQDITLSAGITIVKPRQPLARTMIKAEEALELSKERSAKAAETAKDQCTALGETMKWKQVQHLVKEAFSLEAWIQDGILPRTFVQRLLVYARLYDRYSNGDPSGLKYVALLHWDIKRNLARQKQREPAQWATKLMQLENPSVRHLGFIGRFAQLLTQTTGEEG